MDNEIEKLKLMDYEKQWKELEKYSVEKLEALAVENFSNYRKFKEDKCADNMLEKILSERCHKLNSAFEESPENVRRFLEINSQFISAFEKAREESNSVADKLKKKINDGDPFIMDYDIEARIMPFIMMTDKETGDMYEPDEGIDELLHRVLPKNIMNFSYQHHIDEGNINFDKETNWDTLCGIDPKLLGDTYICYAMHELWEHAHWSLHDILRINYLWIDVEIIHQHFIKVV